MRKVRRVVSPGLKIKILCDDDRNVGGMKSGNLFRIKGMFEKDDRLKLRSEKSNVRMKVAEFLKYNKCPGF